jgi:hypothetical protein
MKIKDLPNWPPSPGGASHWAHRTPASDQAVFKALIRVQEDWVVFTSVFEEREQTYDFQAPSPAVAKNMAVVLQGDVGGNTITQLGELQL